ncbi:kinase-like domain-containing protein [Russula ochroleuca]|uniref:Kinase-like domain-containing protein n=1 Tax=Russula ochroleuca TaxID=152965 RepID=A0A9P5JWP1_9AGAM|nr:kinase-like domain-containing protein [Russula ochroleuca]
MVNAQNQNLSPKPIQKIPCKFVGELPAVTSLGRTEDSGYQSGSDNSSGTALKGPRVIDEVSTSFPYQIGEELGEGTYSIVQEAVCNKTGKHYACKVIDRELMEGREFMVEYEISALKRLSGGHRNVVTLYDYVETSDNLYLFFDLCSGGELFDRICTKGHYHELDAAKLVRTIMKAVQHIHNGGVVHRDLKPENLLFRTPAEDADIMIADFGLSRVMEEDGSPLLTDVNGTTSYMAPEIFKKTGHGKPVDIWAIGAITYYLLVGFTPFSREDEESEIRAIEQREDEAVEAIEKQEIQAIKQQKIQAIEDREEQSILAGDYKFEPEEDWENVSQAAKDFVTACLTVDPTQRPTAAELLKHRWLADEKPYCVPDPVSPTDAPKDLLPRIQKRWDARKCFRRAVWVIIAIKRMSMLVSLAFVGPTGGLRPHIQKPLDARAGFRRVALGVVETERMSESMLASLAFPGPTGGLLPHTQKRLDASLRKRFPRSPWGPVITTEHMSKSMLASLACSGPDELDANITKYLEESEKENVNEGYEVAYYQKLTGRGRGRPREARI